MKKNIIWTVCFIVSSFATYAQVPKFNWVKAASGSISAGGNSIAIDASGNSYVIGTFYGSIDCDPSADSLILESFWFDIVIYKLDASGKLVWAKKIGGQENDLGLSIALDGAGNLYATGQFGGTVDFNPGPGAFNLTSDGTGSLLRDIYVLKLDLNGNFVWAKKVGGTSIDQGNTIKTDTKGNVYIAGHFYGNVDFDPGSGKSELNSFNYSSDAFVLKLNSLGNFVWVKQLGGWGKDNINLLNLDTQGSIYTTGYFTDTADFNPGSSTYNLISAGKEDIFISKLDSSGNFIWAKKFGGVGQDMGYSVAVDPTGKIYTTGTFYETLDFDPGASTFNLTSAGLDDIFILKLDNSGNFAWAKRMGSTSYDKGFCILTDDKGNNYTSGEFTGTVDLDPGSGTLNASSLGYEDIFISKLDASGNFIWSINMGGVGTDYGRCMVLNASGSIYTTGKYSSIVDFDHSSGITKISGSENGDIFVHKMTQGGAGIETNLNRNKISIFPNPTNGDLNIVVRDLNISKIQILNHIGQIVMEEKNIHHSQFNIQHLPQGLYLVRVIGDKQIIATQKIIKQ
ncbi:MAG: T9SS type A sorting domain-containing protein [Bacteroidia bacterium]